MLSELPTQFTYSNMNLEQYVLLLMFQLALNKFVRKLLYTHTHTHIYIYIYV